MFFTRRVNTERIMNLLSDVLFCPIVLQGQVMFNQFFHEYAKIGDGTSQVNHEENALTLANTRNSGTGNCYLFIGPCDVLRYRRCLATVKYDAAGSGRFAMGFTPSRDVSSVAPGETLASKIPGAFEATDPKTSSAGPWRSGIKFEDYPGVSGQYFLYFELINSGMDVNKVKIYESHFEV